MQIESLYFFLSLQADFNAQVKLVKRNGCLETKH